ncbi:hypothetical protein BJ165DRAFT_1490007 [Panaeolus papilionaceus]|nr:hypothetical protein BJ165DRAFT_1490007 [Panaeolus papilionaceus]
MPNYPRTTVMITALLTMSSCSPIAIDQPKSIVKEPPSPESQLQGRLRGFTVQSAASDSQGSGPIIYPGRYNGNPMDLADPRAP